MKDHAKLLVERLRRQGVRVTLHDGAPVMYGKLDRKDAAAIADRQAEVVALLRAEGQR